jgi:hypothetical protein
VKVALSRRLLLLLLPPACCQSCCRARTTPAVLMLQGAARTFHAFDAQRTGRISLDFSQFVYAASNVM